MKRNAIEIMGDMDVLLSSFHSFSESLRIIAETGAEIAGSFRSCIIIKNMRNELILKAGKGNHGIGEKITGDSERFLRKVMHEHQQLLIKNPASHPATPHLKDIANAYGIATSFFVPLTLENSEVIGIMVYEFAEGAEKHLTAAVSFAKYVARKVVALYQLKIKKEMEDRLKNLQILGEHSAKIAHAIRNILMSLVGNLRHLKDSTLLSEHDAAHALFVFQEMEVLERWVDQVLKHTSFSPKSLSLEKHNIITVLHDFVGKKRLSSSCTVNLHFDEAHPVVLSIDKKWIEDCVNDIVMNAQDAGAQNVWIEVSKRPKERRFTISIRNDGEPIDPKKINVRELSEIFDPFFTTKKRGFGLGLSIVKAMVQCHGGSISVESNGHDEYAERPHTVFIISLPL